MIAERVSPASVSLGTPIIILFFLGCETITAPSTNIQAFPGYNKVSGGTVSLTPDFGRVSEGPRGSKTVFNGFSHRRHFRMTSECRRNGRFTPRPPKVEYPSPA